MLKLGYGELFSKGMVPLENNEIFLIKDKLHLKKILEHYFNILNNEKNELTKYNLYIDNEMNLYTEIDRIKEFKKLIKKTSIISNLAQEIFYVNFKSDEITGKELINIIEKFKTFTRKNEMLNKIPKAKWEYFVFHCNQEDEGFHFHRIFQF